MVAIERLNDFRRQILAGEDISKDSLRSAIEELVGERLAAHAADAPKTKASKEPPVNLDTLLTKLL